MLVTPILLALIALSAVSASPINKQNDQPSSNHQVCSTPDCALAAAEVLKNMNATVDPCDDFYNFACGGYEQTTPMRDDQISITSFSQITELISKQLKSALEEPAQADEPKPLTLIKQFYSSCIDEDAIEEDGLNSVKLILKEAGGWPVVEGSEWKEDEFQWMNMFYRMRQAGLMYDHFVSVDLRIDVKNASRQLITLDQVELGFPHQQFAEGLENNVIKAFCDFMVDMAVIFGADEEEALAEMEDVLDFIYSLSKLQTPAEERRDSTRMYNAMTVKEIQQKYPGVQWAEYLDNVIGVAGIKISEDDVINVVEPQFIKGVIELTSKTPKRVLANFAMSKTAVSLAGYLTKEVRNRALKFAESAFGIRSMPPRWQDCVSEASEALSMAASALYVKKYFDEDAKVNAQTLVSDLEATFLDMLKQIDWMDASTKKKAIEKAEAMKFHIAYPKELLDDKELENYYSDIQPKPNDGYLKIVLMVRKFLINNEFKKLRLPVDKSDWKQYSAIANLGASYHIDDNAIQLPAGILQGVFFGKEKPHYMNYGSIGFVIGHEITHGFDDQGRQLDKNGQLSDWWEVHTKEAFLEKANCIIEQYGNYTAPKVGVNLNGINTQGENIADNGGIKEAYLAYKALVERNGEEPRLPGLDYSPAQMFWIASANVWCSKQRDEYLRMQIMTDVHSPPYYRVLGTFSNSEYFAQDFNCPSGSKMNPKHKCDVW